MNQAAKLLIRSNGKYLLLYRTDHPRFGSDPDLPGGTVERGESLVEATVREVQEEISVTVAEHDLKELYYGNAYSHRGMYFALFFTDLKKQPEVALSWEHSAFEWLDRDTFVKRSRGASDSFMHMVADTIEKMGV